MILPSLSARWAAIRAIARGALALTGIRVTVTGAERLPRGNAVILFNHTSYMDAVIIAVGAAGEPAFVAKKEFADQPFAGSFMRRLGVSFVERFDAAASLADAEAVTASRKPAGCSCSSPKGRSPARRVARLLHGCVQGRGGSEPAGGCRELYTACARCCVRSVFPRRTPDQRDH